MAGQWMSAEEIAVHLGVAKDTIYRWINDKGLPAHRMGRLWKFQQAEVDDWVRAGRAENPVVSTSGEPHGGS